MGVAAGDLVVVPTFTFVRSVNPIYYLGARPVFIDAEEDTWNIDLARRKVFEQHRQQLTPYGFGFIKEPNGHFSSHWLSTVLLKQGLKPLEALAKPQKEGVETRPFWNPMHVQPAFVQEKSVLNGVAMGLFERGLCLPSGVANQEASVDALLKLSASFQI